MRRIVGIVVVGLVLAFGVPSAEAETYDDWWTEDAVDTVLNELVLLHEAGLFISDPTLDPLLDTMVADNGWGYVLPAELYDFQLDLYDMDDYGVDSLTSASVPPGLSPEAALALGRISNDDRAAINNGSVAFIDAEPYIHALGDLLRRYGHAPTGARDPGELAVLETFSWHYLDYTWSVGDYIDPVWQAANTTTTTTSTPVTTATTSPPTTAAPVATTVKGPATTNQATSTTSQKSPLGSVTTVGSTTSALTGFAAADAGAYGPDVTGRAGSASGAAADGTSPDGASDDVASEADGDGDGDGDGLANGASAAGEGAAPDTVPFDDTLVDLTSGRDAVQGGPSLSSATAVIATLLVAGVAGGGWLALTRRRRGGADIRLIAETSRKLAGAQTEAEVIETAVLATVRFTGAKAGAYHRMTAAGLKLAGTTSTEVFAASVQSSGTLVDIANAGQPLRAIIEGDPAFAPPSLAMAAAPVVNEGQISGVLVVAREPSSPFAADAIETLGALAPMLGSALHSTQELETAMQGSEVDWLTSLPNRRKFDHDVAQAAEKASTVSVAMVDIDHFKSFNDTYGHETGDLVLREVAQTVASTIRPVDTVYRYGGEEFSVLLAECDEEEASQVMERVRLSVQQMVMPESGATRESGGMTVTVSVGLASGPGAAIADLLVVADQSLYAAKHNGRNRVAVGRSATASR